MWDGIWLFLTENAAAFGALGGVAAFLSFVTNLRLFRRVRLGRDERQDLQGRIHTLNGQIEDLVRGKREGAERLAAIDPERVIDEILNLRRDGDWAGAEARAEVYAGAHAEVLGLVAEVLVEARLLDAARHGAAPLREAVEIAVIGRAAAPGNTRLATLAETAAAHLADIEAGNDPADLPGPDLSAEALNALSNRLYHDRRMQMAEIAARRSVPLALRDHGAQSLNFANAIGHHAHTLVATGQPEEAYALRDQARDIARDVGGETHPEYIKHLFLFASSVAQRGETERAHDMYRDVLRLTQEHVGVDTAEFVERMNGYGGFLYETGDIAGAETAQRKALEIARQRSDIAPDTMWAILNNLAFSLAERGQGDAAQALFREAAEFAHASFGPDHPNTRHADDQLAPRP